MIAQAPAPPQQLRVSFRDPITWHRYLHNDQCNTVLVWQPSSPGRRNTKIEPIAERNTTNPGSILTQLSGQEEVFATPNEFNGWRRRGLLRSLRAFWVDIDNPEAEPNQLMEDTLDKIAHKGCPQPTMMVLSGGGIHAYWVLPIPLSNDYLDCWERIQRHLTDAFGGDSQANDCARVLRLPGTISSKRGGIEVEGQIVTGKPVALDRLGCSVIPTVSGEKPKPKKGKATKKKTTSKKAGSKKTTKKKPTSEEESAGSKESNAENTIDPSLKKWYAGVYRDIFTITHHHWPQGAPIGHRDNVLFLASVALSHYCHPERLEEEIMETASQLTPTLTRKEVVRQTGTLVRRMKNGEGPYKHRYKKLRSKLSDLLTEEIEPKLECLMSKEEKHRRQKNSRKQQRAAPARPRSQYREDVNRGKARTNPHSNEQQRPWKKFGIDRATWYRRGKPDPNSSSDA